MQPARALVDVRLVDRDQSSVGQVASGSQRRGDLGRVVAVVVVDADAAAVGDELEAPVDASNLARAAAALSRPKPASSSAASAAAAFRRLCSPGTASSSSTGSSSQPRTTCGALASQLSKNVCNSAVDENAAW